MRARQSSFLPKPRLEHGGQIRQGRRKLARPIDPKRPLHLVMRASMARGRRSLLSPGYERRVREIVRRASVKYEIRVRRYVNVGNHLHLIVQTRARKAFQGFLREISGRIAMLVTGARKSFPIDSLTLKSEGIRRVDGTKRFWDLLAYTRVVNWGRDYERMKMYIVKNHFEAAGINMRKMKALGYRLFSISELAQGPPEQRAFIGLVRPCFK